MPIEYDLLPDVIWFRTVGDVDYDNGFEVLESAAREARKQNLPRKRPAVFDIRESRERRKAGELRAIAHFVSVRKDVFEPRCAVVTSDDLHFGLARMFAAFAASHDVKVTVLRHIDEVPGWLAATPDDPS